MSFKEIYQFITALKQDLILEELLVKEYSDVLSDILSKEEEFSFLSRDERQEISQITQTLKNDSIRHRETIINLMSEAEKEGSKIFRSAKK